MHTARLVYEKFCNGDAIGDSELAEALAFFKKLENDLSVLGPVFRLSANEAGRVARSLQDFTDAREQ